METVAGGQFYGYCDSELVHRGTEPIMGTPILEDQTHPRVFVESKSHGVVVNSPVVFGEYLGEDEADFRGGDGIVYRYKAIAEEPLDGNDRDVGYALEPILETLWPRRSEARNGDTFASVFHFTPECPLPDRMAGDNYREPGGETPWAWDDLDDEGVRRGEWFLTPARAVSSHFAIREPFSLEYTYNPFLGIPR